MAEPVAEGGSGRGVRVAVVAAMLVALGVLAVVLLRTGTDAGSIGGGGGEYPAATQPQGYGSPELVCRVEDGRIDESSGMVVAGDRWYTVNDSAPILEVFVLDRGCAVLDVLSYPEIDPVDVEDVGLSAAGDLWVADTGDNRLERSEVALYQLADMGKGPTRTYRLRYEDGPHDAETLLLAGDGTPYLVTKSVTGRSVVYAPTEPLQASATGTLEEVARVSFGLTGATGGPVGPLGSLLATGGSVAVGGSTMVIRTYTDAYVWSLVDADVLAALDGGTPVRVDLPDTRQGEAVALTADASTMYSTSEGNAFPLHAQHRTG